MFFGRPVTPELFFTSGGLSTFVEAPVRIGVGPARLHRSGHDNGLRVNRNLLRQRFGRIITRDLQHCAAPMRRSVAAELEREFADDYARTAASRFRSATDISVTNSLYHYYALLTGRALPTTQPRVQYIQTTLRESLGQMEKLLERRNVDMFCLNDGSTPEIPEEVRVPVLRATLERYYPIRAPWELDAAELAGVAPMRRRVVSVQHRDGRRRRVAPQRGAERGQDADAGLVEAAPRLRGIHEVELAGHIHRVRRSGRSCRRRRAPGCRPARRRGRGCRPAAPSGPACSRWPTRPRRGSPRRWRRWSSAGAPPGSCARRCPGQRRQGVPGRAARRSRPGRARTAPAGGASPGWCRTGPAPRAVRRARRAARR